VPADTGFGGSSGNTRSAGDQPLARLALRLGDLGHSSHRDLRAPFARFVHALHRREVEPFVRGDVIDADARPVEYAKPRLKRFDASLARFGFELRQANQDRP
jgi:hypothetical protein